MAWVPFCEGGGGGGKHTSRLLADGVRVVLWSREFTDALQEKKFQKAIAAEFIGTLLFVFLAGAGTFHCALHIIGRCSAFAGRSRWKDDDRARVFKTIKSLCLPADSIFSRNVQAVSRSVD